MAVLTAVCFSSCRVERFLKDDEYVLYKNKYKIVMSDSTKVPKEVKAALASKKQFTYQRPNTSILGIAPLRLKLGIYTLSSATKDNRFNRWIQRRSEAPVVYDEGSAIRTTQQLEGLLESKGCFHSKASFDTVKIKKRDITIQYTIIATPRYRIGATSQRSEDPTLQHLLDSIAEDSYIRKGDPYDREVLARERTRIHEELLNASYYTATKELVRFEVDTNARYDSTTSVRTLAVTTILQMPTSEDGVKVPLQKYRIDQVYIHPTYYTGRDTTIIVEPYVARKWDKKVHKYTERYKTDFRIVYKRGEQERPDFRRRTLAHTVTIFHDEYYEPRHTDNCKNSFQALRNFKRIDVLYRESPRSSDSLRLLDATVLLDRSNKQRFTASIELNNASSLGTKEQRNFFTSGNFGIEGTLTYLNKNLFGGAEQLKVELNALLEIPKMVFASKGLKFREVFAAFESGINISMDIPEFLLPFTRNIPWQIMRPHTVFSIGGSYQYRPYYERVPINTSLAYTWTHSRRAHNQVMPIELTFVRFFNLDAALVSRLNTVSDLRLKYQYNDHFIFDARYDYTYSNQVYGTRNNFHFVHLSAETAGNLLHGLNLAFHGTADENGIRRVFGVPYSQYARATAEYKHYLYWGKKSTFVSRVMVGIGIPYANSSLMPYEKAFFGGGPTTIRAWQLRHLGPGNYNGFAKGVLERMGDMSLVINLEQRFPIAWIFEGAVFADAGNVWLLNRSEEFPDGEFSFRNLFRSIALGAGIGLRANISIVTIRVDVALPLYDPGYAEEDRWRPRHWSFNQIVTNFGIDYPF